MLSWREWYRQSPWKLAALVWLALAPFLFFSVAQDSLHTDNCPDQQQLIWATHSTPPAFHNAPIDSASHLDCLACAWASVTLLVLALNMPWVLESRFVRFIVPQSKSVYCSLAVRGARGPPAFAL